MTWPLKSSWYAPYPRLKKKTAFDIESQRDRFADLKSVQLFRDKAMDSSDIFDTASQEGEEEYEEELSAAEVALRSN